jgi:hypothetical protein
MSEFRVLPQGYSHFIHNYISSKLRNVSGFGVTTSLPKRNYIFKVEEYEWIWCNHLVTPDPLIFLNFVGMSGFGVLPQGYSHFIDTIYPQS